MNDATRIDKTHDTRTVEKKTSAEITDMFNELLGMNGRSHTRRLETVSLVNLYYNNSKFTRHA